MAYIPTAKQGEAWRMLREGAQFAMLVGGSRSGKTTLFIEEILCRAAMYPRSRHLIARLRLIHARASIWMDTIPKVMEMEGLDPKKVKTNESAHYLMLPNGSEIWIDGLDDKERVDKILGREYTTIYFNECSEMPYDSVSTVLTRLAQNVPGCENKGYFDLNPVGKFHWAYKLFVQKIFPTTGSPVPNPEDYDHMYLQPDDNREHLPPGYIEYILDTLPEHKRRRFRMGEWGEPEGVIFKNWQIVDDIPEEVVRRGKRSYGLDFGFSVDPSALVDIWLYGKNIYLDELIYEHELTNQQLARKIKTFGPTHRIIADSAEPKSIKEIYQEGIDIVGADKGQDSVRQGIDWLQEYTLYVTRRSYNLQDELQNYVWKVDRSGKTTTEPVNDYDHGISAARYGCEPFMRKAPQLHSKPIRGLI